MEESTVASPSSKNNHNVRTVAAAAAAVLLAEEYQLNVQSVLVTENRQMVWTLGSRNYLTGSQGRWSCNHRRIRMVGLVVLVCRALAKVVLHLVCAHCCHRH
jgi:hypothetical protein